MVINIEEATDLICQWFFIFVILIYKDLIAMIK